MMGILHIERSVLDHSLPFKDWVPQRPVNTYLSCHRSLLKVDARNPRANHHCRRPGRP